jgi:hypothetical protein
MSGPFSAAFIVVFCVFYERLLLASWTSLFSRLTQKHVTKYKTKKRQFLSSSADTHCANFGCASA